MPDGRRRSTEYDDHEFDGGTESASRWPQQGQANTPTRAYPGSELYDRLLDEARRRAGNKYARGPLFFDVKDGQLAVPWSEAEADRRERTRQAQLDRDERERIRGVNEERWAEYQRQFEPARAFGERINSSILAAMGRGGGGSIDFENLPGPMAGATAGTGGLVGPLVGPPPDPRGEWSYMRPSGGMQGGEPAGGNPASAGAPFLSERQQRPVMGMPGTVAETFEQQVARENEEEAERIRRMYGQPLYPQQSLFGGPVVR